MTLAKVPMLMQDTQGLTGYPVFDGILALLGVLIFGMVVFTIASMLFSR